MLVRLTSMAFPVMDLGVLAVALRLLVGAGVRGRSFFLLVGALTLLLAADVVYGLQQLAGVYTAGNFVDAMWLGYYLLLGAAALHPSMSALAEPSPITDLAAGRGRLLSLGAAALMAPLAMVLQQVLYQHSRRGAARVRGRGDVPAGDGADGRVGDLPTPRGGLAGPGGEPGQVRSDDRERLRPGGPHRPRPGGLLREPDAWTICSATNRMPGRDAASTSSSSPPTVTLPGTMSARAAQDCGHATGRCAAARRSRGPAHPRVQLPGSDRSPDGHRSGLERRRCHRPARTGRRTHPAGLHRRPHGPREPGTVHRPADPGAGPLRPARNHRRGPAHRPRPVQDPSTTASATPPATRSSSKRPARLASSVRTGDTVARHGGDEFTVLLEDLDAPDLADEAADRILSLLRQPITVDGTELRLTASVGVVLSDAELDEPEELMRAADLAMYHAKNTGRGRRPATSPAMSTRAHDDLALNADLDHALDRGEFEVYYQPTFTLADRHHRRRRGAPALAPPGQRPGLAEDVHPARRESGQIVPIGRWVLRQACSQAVAWHAELPADSPLAIAVNLSMRQLADPDLVADVCHILRRHRPRPTTAHPGDHRERADGRRRRGPPQTARPQGPRAAAGHRRLRHWLLVPRLPAALPRRHRQDRQDVHRRGARRRPWRRRADPRRSSTSVAALDSPPSPKAWKTPRSCPS